MLIVSIIRAMSGHERALLGFLDLKDVKCSLRLQSEISCSRSGKDEDDSHLRYCTVHTHRRLSSSYLPPREPEIFKTLFPAYNIYSISLDTSVVPRGGNSRW
jgi:hypothetical protein